jgi:hypothetical protein
MIGERVDCSTEAGSRVLQSAARLLLEYHERSALLKQHLDRLAARLGISVSTGVSYRETRHRRSVHRQD